MTTYNIYYFSLDEFLQDYLEIGGTAYVNPTLATFMTTINTKFQIPTSSITQDTNTQKLFDLLVARYHNHAIIRTESENITSIDNFHVFRNWIVNLFNVINFTYDKYKELISYYTTSKTHLMDKIKGSSQYVSKFRDTPQNEGTDYGDPFNTNTTQYQSDSENDGDSKIARLKEIEDKISNIYLKWLNEFDKIFIEEEI